jgi:uncharacterized protein (DUF1501 family)
MRKVSRREFIGGVAGIAGMRLLSPIAVRAGDWIGQAAPDPVTAQRNRLVVIFMQGGNDGLNTVVPTADVPGALRRSVYEKVRPSIGYDAAELLPLDRAGDADWSLGLNPNLRVLHSLYEQDRVAIVQGVDYPSHSYSHFVSTDIWESGEPGRTPDSGWLGRHLDRAGIGDGELRGLGIGYELPLILQGTQKRGVEVESIAATAFSDGTGAVGDARHQALRKYGDHPAAEPLRQFAGVQAASTVDLVEALEAVQAPPKTGNALADAMLTSRALLQGNFGVESVFVSMGGFDTHTSQVGQQEALLARLDRAIEAFLFGTIGGAPIAGVGAMPADLAARTLIVTTSEFARRIGENGTGAVAGTDHGAAGPLFVVGPPAGSTIAGATLVPGLHGDHPPMGTPTLPADNLTMTTELRSVYQSVLQYWLRDPDPSYEGTYEPLPGLITTP